jgi:hypothetical protein
VDEMSDKARSGAAAQGRDANYREIPELPPASYLKAAAPRLMTDEQRNQWEGLEQTVRALERARLQAVGLPGGDRATRLASLDASLVRYEAERQHLRRTLRPGT